RYGRGKQEVYFGGHEGERELVATPEPPPCEERHEKERRERADIRAEQRLVRRTPTSPERIAEYENEVAHTEQQRDRIARILQAPSHAAHAVVYGSLQQEDERRECAHH